jgi:hypothetical protein
MKKLILALMLIACMSGMVSALDFTSFPAVIESGDIMVSPVFKAAYYYGHPTLAYNLAFDYALSVPLTLGLEAGYLMRQIPGYADVSSLPVMLRAAYHPNFGPDNLNIFLLLKAGYNIPLVNEVDFEYAKDKLIGGVSFGGSAGTRYFFNKTAGALLEFGYDFHTLNIETVYPEPNSDWNKSEPWWLTTWLTVGITFKF